MKNKRMFPLCDSFYDFIIKINDWYGEIVAFKTTDKEWYYHDLYKAVSTVASTIENKQAVYCIDVKDPAFFFIAFMAVTISGNVAWLNDKALSEEYVCISDNDVQKMLNDAKNVKRCKKCILEDRYERDQVSVVAQSSGTTSVSKGVMLSQKNILTDMIAGAREYDYPKGAIYYKVLPYQHLFGLVADLLGPLYSGGTICYSNDSINLFKYLNVFKPTHMNLPPVIVMMIEKMLLNSKDSTTVTGGRLKKIMCAGAAISRESQIALKKYGINVFVAYGLTECSPCISMNSDRNHKDGSVGKILAGVNVKIEDNEILVNGNTVMLGYWNDQQATNKVFKEGWLMTGDLGYIDDEGFLFLTGRKSNLIVFEDGIKLSPENLENEINNIPGVKECMVYSTINNEHTTINVKVEVETEQDVQVENKIKEIAYEMQLGSRLRKIEFIKNELPKNKLGKIIRGR